MRLRGMMNRISCAAEDGARRTWERREGRKREQRWMTGPHRRPACGLAVGAGRSARRLLAIVTLSVLFALPGVERAAWADSHASSTDGYILECPDQHRCSGNYRVIAGETFRVTLYTNRNIGVFDRMTGAFTTQAVDSSSVGRFASHDQVKTDGGRGKERVGFDIETCDESDFGRLDDRFRMKAAGVVGVLHRGTLQCTITILDDDTFPWRRRDSFEVRARSAAGDGPPSNRVTATPLPVPVLASIEITSDAGSDDTYAIGDRIVATVTFDRTIQVDTQGESPTLALTIGNGTGQATCAASADQTQLECTYTGGRGRRGQRRRLHRREPASAQRRIHLRHLRLDQRRRDARAFGARERRQPPSGRGEAGAGKRKPERYRAQDRVERNARHRLGARPGTIRARRQQRHRAEGELACHERCDHDADALKRRRRHPPVRAGLHRAANFRKVNDGEQLQLACYRALVTFATRRQ